MESLTGSTNCSLISMLPFIRGIEVLAGHKTAQNKDVSQPLYS